MGKINVLSFAVANLIAAGEVVDRPASIAKELMENSIDAGATRITVEIQNGGVTLLRVTDDGCGMTMDDLPIAIRRHATSKIKDATDLDTIITLGFRGEALAATCAVANVRIISKPRDAELGAMLEVEGGNIKSLTERGASDGTTVIVEDLFQNVPARRKFLKRDVTEAMAVTATVEKIALSHPEIAITLIVDGKHKVETSGDGSLQNVICAIFGRDFAARLIPVEGSAEDVRVSGFVGRTDNVKANRTYENFFVNQRYVRSKTATAAIDQAYVSYLPQERFPVCVLFLETDPRRVDVNVHPSKLEIKFSNEKAVFEAIYYSVRAALEQNVSRPEVRIGSSVPRVSDSVFPISNGKDDPLKGLQLRMTGEGASSAGKGGSVFDHVTAEEYRRRYLGETVASAPALRGQDKVEASVTEKANAVLTEGNGEMSPDIQNNSDGGAPVDTQSTIEIRLPDQFPNLSTLTPEQYVAEYDKIFTEEEVSLLEQSKAELGEEEYNQRFVLDELERIKRVLNGEPPYEEETEEDPKPILEVAEQTFSEKKSKQPQKLKNYRVLGEAFYSYVLVEVEDKLLIVDKHAAHERIIFEQLKANMKAMKVSSQLLLLPLNVMLMTNEVDLVEEYRDELESVGFAFTTARNTVSITAIPDGIDQAVVGDMLTAIVERIRSETGTAQLTRDIIFEKALYQAACKAAIKAGREYAEQHIEWLVDEMMRLPDITFCPHGRPVALELTKKNLDHQFERT